MDENVFDLLSRGRSWRVHFQLLLSSALLISFHSSYGFSSNFNFQRKLGGTDHFRRQPFLQAAVADTDDPFVEDTLPERTDTASTSSTTHIVFPGGGIFFYYQAGLVNFLRERYDLSTCTFSGASAGALTATLTAADVDFFEATDLALKMAADAGVWDRSSGLQGIWGPMIEDWLDALLPTSIDTLQDKITLLVTPIPSFGKTKVSRFENREDLIKCNMASVHLPWFLDGQLTSNFRGKPHIDGSFLSKEDDYSPDLESQNNTTVETVVLDWSKDPDMSSKGGLDIVEALSPEGIYGLLERGKRYGKVLEDQGVFDSLEKLK